MTRPTLDQILSSEDHEGLLDVRPLAAPPISDFDRVRNDFEELNKFVDETGFAPGSGPIDHKASVKERRLGMRLKSYLMRPELALRLRDLDRHNLLAGVGGEPEPDNLDAILDLDDDLLSAPSEDIFTFRHARPGLAKPDRVSERRPCVEFERFKPLFAACVADLVSGKRKSLKFANEQEVMAGEFFILNGVMVYVAEVNDPHIRNGRRNARLRLIFENGTEGENLLRSLATELYKDPSGRRISAPEVGPLFESEATTVLDTAPSERTAGTIYVVRSLSPHPDVKRWDGHLFKIGFTTGIVEDRLRSAKDDPTFLFAPVHLVRTFAAINLNTAKLETLLHRFFADARLDVEMLDRFGRPFKPKEWFILPLPVVERAVRLILDGSILGYRYDAAAQSILRSEGQ